MRFMLFLGLLFVHVVAFAGIVNGPHAPVGFIPNQGQWPSGIMYGAWTSGGIVWIVNNGFVVDVRGTDKNGTATSTIEEHRFVDLTGASRWNEEILPSSPTIQFLTKRSFLQHENLRPRSRVSVADPITGAYLTFEITEAGDVSYTWGHVVLGVGNPNQGIIAQESLSLDKVILASAIKGEAEEQITGTVIGTDGDVVVCGWTTTMNLVVPLGGKTSSAKAGEDGFVAVYSADLTTIKSWTYIAGAADDRALAICLGQGGSVCVAGETNSADIPMASGSSGQLYSAGIDGFFLRFSSDLSKLLAGRYINGDKDEHVRAMGSDVTGAVYICGYTNSAKGFNVTNGYDVTYNGSTDAFLVKITASAANIAYATYFGGGGEDVFNALHVDQSGQVTVVGSTASSDFKTAPEIDPLYWWLYTERPYDWTYNGGAHDAVAVRFRPDGGGLVFSTFYGGAGDDIGKAVCVSTKDETMIIGETNSEDLPMVASLQAQLNGPSDVFVGVVDAVGRSLVRATYYGGENSETVTAASYLSGDQFMITGTTTSTRMLLTGLGSVTDLKGSEDCFLTLMTTSSLVYGTLIGWPSTEVPLALVRDAVGDIYVGGHTKSEVVGAYGGGRSDAFLVKWIFGQISTAQPHGGETNCLGRTLQIAWNTQEMPLSQKYDIDVSADNGTTWLPVARGVTGKTMYWTPDDAKYISAVCLVRVTTTRGHVAVMEVPFRIVALPAILQQPESISRCAGDRTELKVNVSGEDVSYQWRKNQVVLRGATSPSFVLSSVSDADVGQYDVVISGPCASNIVSAVATVSVSHPTAIVTEPTSLQIRQYEVLRLTVSATGSDLRYQWRQNDVNIPAPIGTSEVLVIDSARSIHNGRYECIVTGSCGVDTTATVQVVVDPIVSSVAEETLAFVSISPNPSSSWVSIHVRNREALRSLRLVSLVGATVAVVDAEQNDSSGSEYHVDVSDLPPGVYGLVCGWADSFTSYPIVIRR